MMKSDVTAWLSEETSEKSMNPRLQTSQVNPLILELKAKRQTLGDLPLR
jgi:hypothetical protein